MLLGEMAESRAGAGSREMLEKETEKGGRKARGKEREKKGRRRGNKNLTDIPQPRDQGQHQQQCYADGVCALGVMPWKWHITSVVFLLQTQ